MHAAGQSSDLSYCKLHETWIVIYRLDTHPVLTMASKQVLQRKNHIVTLVSWYTLKYDYWFKIGFYSCSVTTSMFLLQCNTYWDITQCHNSEFCSENDDSYLCKRWPHGRTWAPILDVWISWTWKKSSLVNIIIQRPFLYSQFMYCMFHYLHTHWAVLPRNIFNTLKHRNNTRKGEH